MTYNLDSMKHVTLMYAKVVRGPFTIDDLLDFSQIYKDRDAARHSIAACLKKGDLVEVGDAVKKDKTWKITPQGIDTIYQLGGARARLRK